VPDTELLALLNNIIEALDVREENDDIFLLLLDHALLHADKLGHQDREDVVGLDLVLSDGLRLKEVLLLVPVEQVLEDRLEGDVIGQVENALVVVVDLQELAGRFEFLRDEVHLIEAEIDACQEQHVGHHPGEEILVKVSVDDHRDTVAAEYDNRRGEDQREG